MSRRITVLRLKVKRCWNCQNSMFNLNNIKNLKNSLQFVKHGVIISKVAETDMSESTGQ